MVFLTMVAKVRPASSAAGPADLDPASLEDLDR
jgi:hypothetical protein